MGWNPDSLGVSAGFYWLHVVVLRKELLFGF